MENKCSFQCPIYHRGFNFPKTIEQVPYCYFNPRTPPPPRQVPIYRNQTSFNPEYNIDVSTQRDLSPQYCIFYQSALPPAMHRNIQFLAATPPPTSYDECDNIYSDNISRSDVQIRDTDLEYYMPESDRGIGAVFINESFPDRPKRPGVKRDKENLERIFTMMRLKVDIFLDKTRSEILAELLKLAKSANSSHFVLCIAFSTHGDTNDTIYGSDGIDISLRTDIMPIFKPENCKALEGKPKVFIIQACRGDKIDYIGPTVFSDACEKDELVSSETDFLISYACAPDYMAFRSEKEGAWFLNELYNAYRSYSDKYHFMDILTLTNQRLMLRAKNGKEFNRSIAQPSHVESTLKKFLWLKFNSCITWNPSVNFNEGVQCSDYQFDGPQALPSDGGILDIAHSFTSSISETTPVKSIESLKSDVYDWNQRDRIIGTLIREDNKQFFKYTGPRFNCLPVYPLGEGEYTGIGIIIVNHSCGTTKREGSVKDLENFKYIFEGLKLKVVVKENINHRTISGEFGFEDFIKNEIKNNLELKCFFLAISTHGERVSGIAGFDGVPIELSSLIATLQVKELVGKPKVAIVQACRGSRSDYQVNRVEADSIPKVATFESDLLVAYSCAHGYKSWRDKENGSWFVDSMRRCYEEMKGQSNILELLTATTSYMLEHFKSQNEMGVCYKQPAEIRCTLSSLLNI